MRRQPSALPAVRISCAEVDVGPERLGELALLLSEDERERAARLALERDRSRFVARRGWLRELLGRHLEVEPLTLQFTSDRYGKPALRLPADLELSFNVAHSEGLAACVMARGVRVGIDLELIRPDFPVAEVAGRFFTAAELDEFDALPPAGRIPGFFELWASKEAYLKGIGTGLVGDGATGPGPAGRPWAADWSVIPLELEPGYAAAVAVEAPGLDQSDLEFPSPTGPAHAA